MKAFEFEERGSVLVAGFEKRGGSVGSVATGEVADAGGRKEDAEEQGCSDAGDAAVGRHADGLGSGLEARGDDDITSLLYLTEHATDEVGVVGVVGVHGYDDGFGTGAVERSEDAAANRDTEAAVLAVAHDVEREFPLMLLEHIGGMVGTAVVHSKNPVYYGFIFHVVLDAREQTAHVELFVEYRQDDNHTGLGPHARRGGAGVRGRILRVGLGH